MTSGKLQRLGKLVVTHVYFRVLSSRSLNHVRIPIGFWAFDVSPDEPFIQGQLPYLQKAIEWAGNNGLKVVIDLHGSPGSQNGCVASLLFRVMAKIMRSFDNSGQRIATPLWHTNATHVERTNAVIKTLVDMFIGNPDVIPIIAPLNEYVYAVHIQAHV